MIYLEIFITMALLPRITKLDNSILPSMYKEWWVLVAVYNDCMYFHRNEQEVYNEENQDKKAMYEKMKELKRDPVAYKELEAQALSLITPEQRRSQAMPFHRDAKLRELVMEMIQE